LGPDGSMIIKENILKLHSNDNRYKISNEFQKIWKNYKSKKVNPAFENQLVLK
jgi:DNA-directed RNA polymerase